MTDAGYQANTSCGDLQLCTRLEAGIEGATDVVGQRRLERVRGRRSEEEAGSAEGDQEIENVEGLLNNLTIEMMGTEDKAAEDLEAALGMEVNGYGEDEGVGEGEEEVAGTLWALGALEFLTQDSKPSEKTLVDARNGFNKLILLVMLWTVCHFWPAVARFTFN